MTRFLRLTGVPLLSVAIALACVSCASVSTHGPFVLDGGGRTLTCEITYRHPFIVEGYEVASVTSGAVTLRSAHLDGARNVRLVTVRVWRIPGTHGSDLMGMDFGIPPRARSRSEQVAWSHSIPVTRQPVLRPSPQGYEVLVGIRLLNPDKPAWIKRTVIDDSAEGGGSYVANGTAAYRLIPRGVC